MHIFKPGSLGRTVLGVMSNLRSDAIHNLYMHKRNLKANVGKKTRIISRVVQTQVTTNCIEQTCPRIFFLHKRFVIM